MTLMEASSVAASFLVGGSGNWWWIDIQRRKRPPAVVVVGEQRAPSRKQRLISYHVDGLEDSNDGELATRERWPTRAER